MAKSQRKIGNYIKQAGLSKGYYLHIFAGGVAFLGILLTYASRLMNEINMVVATIPDAQVAGEIQDRLFMVAVIFFISFLAFMTSTVFYMIVLGQRVGGPVIAICAVIDQLKAGDYVVKRNLRKNDELVPIMNGLHELGAVLKEKKS